MPEVVAIIGATEKPNRYAYKAMHSLLAHGHEVRLVNPYKTSIEDTVCYPSVSAIEDRLDTITLYVNPTRLRDHIDAIIKARPARVIMNPGTEDAVMATRMQDAGIEVLRACTLVMLSNGRF